MKRLFRTSKPAGVDPLPPPPPKSPPPQQQQPPPHGQPSGKLSKPPGPTDQNEIKSPSGSLPLGSVTPFPIDMGRDPPPLPQKENKGKERSSVPTLFEIQQMQGHRDSRRDEWVQSQQQQPRPPRPHQDQETPTSSPDGHTNHPRGRHSGSNGLDPLSLPPPVAPHAISASPASSSPSSVATPMPSQAALFLPPGARLPSPPPSLRPGTPTRRSHGAAQIHSQNAYVGSTASHGGILGDVEPFPTPQIGRERGYSSASASGRGSDNESSSLGHTTSPVVPTNGKLHKQPQPQPARSPLANSHGTQLDDRPILSPHPYGHAPLQPVPTPYLLVEEMQGMKLSTGPGRELDGDTPKPIDKEKKKFWGMGWVDKKDKGRREDEDGRRSFEMWRDHDGQAGHVEEPPRGRLLGLDFGRGDQTLHPAPSESVTWAINHLVAMPDPPGASIFDVVDRINHSASPESVSKEAAHAIRKQFKHGNEAERRAASKVWLIMMRNISTRNFRVHASSKKFMASLEPLFLPQLSKPSLSVPTHRIMTDILADLTYMYGAEKGCEGLTELWKKIKMPQEPDQGKPIPADHQIYAPQPMYALGFPHQSPYTSEPPSLAGSRRPSSPSIQHYGIDDRSVPPPMAFRPPSPGRHGPAYANLPNHDVDMRRLTDESTAGKEAASLLTEALVFTRPDELELKPIVQEFYRKCFLAHESLTNQIEWAQAEAAQSRERAIMMSLDHQHHEDTMEERALAMLFEAHGMLGEALKQHDDLERMARDEVEMRQVRERSKKDVRMDRNQPHIGNGFLAPEHQQSSSSRSPSPTPGSRVPVGSPRQMDIPLSHNLRANGIGRSRTPSPDRHPLPHPPKLSASPGLAASPLGRNMRGPRPLPNPFTRDGSQQSLGSTANPSRSGSTVDHADEEEMSASAKPSRKALGKRRAVVDDEDNHFDPDDMFGAKKDAEESSEESVTVDAVYMDANKTPVSYAYDAYQEKLDRESDSSGTGGSGSRSGSGGGSAARSRKSGVPSWERGLMRSSVVQARG